MKTLDAPMPLELDLLKAHRQGDPDAFFQLYRLLSPRIYHYLLAILRERADAEEVLQSVFTEVHRQSDRLLQARDARVYLLRIARNKAIDFMRQRGGAGRNRPLDEALLLPADDASPAELASLREQCARAQRALFELPQEDRELIVLHRLEGWSFREIHDVLGAPESTLSYRYHQAMKTLSEKLQ